MTVTLTPELLADLRKKAGAATAFNPADYYPGQLPQPMVEHRALASPAVVIALLDRIEALEKDAKPPCGCGRPATVRGDPECTGCGGDCVFCKCEPLAPAQSPA